MSKIVKNRQKPIKKRQKYQKSEAKTPAQQIVDMVGVERFNPCLPCVAGRAKQGRTHQIFGFAKNLPRRRAKASYIKNKP